MKHVVCYSGGHSSALVAIEVVRRYGPGSVVLLNHDINERAEHADIKRFKQEIADHLAVPIIYASHPDPDADQFDVCVDAKAFKVKQGHELCTSRLKTEPFRRWLAANTVPAETIVYYGFDAGERVRVQRRSTIMAALGYRTEFPLAHWPRRTVWRTEEIGIARPLTYGVFTHGNCVGCIKAGKQHWYVVYCTRYDVWLKALEAEHLIGHSIDRDDYLEDLQDTFHEMYRAGVPATERIPQQRFWADAKKVVRIAVEETKEALPCECTL